LFILLLLKGRYANVMGSIGLTVKRSAPLRKFFCVPAKRQRIVIINAMKAVTVGNRLFKSIIAIVAVVCL
jgi:hypothetical protein